MDREVVLAILRVNLRPDEGRRSANHHDDDVAKRLGLTDSVDTFSSDKPHTDSPANGSDSTHSDLPDEWQIEWRLMPYTPVGRAIVSATQRLEDGGSSSAHLDAQVILAHVLGVDRSWLFAHYDYELMPAETERYSQLVARRTAAEPVAYLVGKREFYGLELDVDRRVLIPRPETELLVDAVLDHIESRSERHVIVADIGAGSGAIALAVATNCPEATVYATDISEDALSVARQNVSRWDVRHQVTLLRGDLLEPLPEKVDILAANLPYIRSDEYRTLQRDVRDYEPQLALEAGPQGLDVIQRLLRQASAFLKPGGVVFLEIGYEQGEAMLALAGKLMPKALSITVRQDYRGQDRLLLVAI